MIAGFLDRTELEPINAAIAPFNQGSFEEVSDGGLAGGSRKLALSAFGWCPRSSGAEMIGTLKSAFLRAKFSSPEAVVLIVDDDNTGESWTIQAAQT
jgi:hypothetical protein